jgi:hypothetical protein
MKKYISIALIVTLLVAGLLTLTGCNNTTNNNDNNNSSNTDNGTSKSSGFELKFDYVSGNTTHYAHFNTNSDDKVTEFDEDEPNFVRIENENENYVADLELSEDAKEAYEQFKTSAKENDLYVETKFGKYDGYYSNDAGDIYGYILLDTSDSNAYKYFRFVIYLLDESSDKNNIQSVFKASKVQNILNNIEYKVTKLESED